MKADNSMNRIHQLTLAAIALVVGACVPFLGPLPPDGGDGPAMPAIFRDSSATENIDGSQDIRDAGSEPSDVRDAPLDHEGAPGPPGSLILAKVAVVDGDVQHGAVLTDDSVVLTGTFKGAAHFGTQLLTTGGDVDVFVACFESDGTLRWATQIGGPEDDQAGEIGGTPDGSIVVSGAFSGTAVFGQGRAHQVSLSSAGSTDIYLAKYSSSGDLIWALRTGGSDYDTADGLAVGSTGDISLKGDLASGADVTGFLTAGDNQFLAGLSSDGQMRWSHSLHPDVSSGYGCVAIDSNGSTSICGYTESPLALWEGDVAPLIVPGPIPMAYVVTIASSGTLSWANQVTVPGEDISQRFVVSLPGGDLAMGGTLDGSVASIFRTYPVSGAPTDTDLTVNIAAGYKGAFIARYRTGGYLASVATLSAVSLTAAGGASGGDGSVLVSGTFEGALAEMTSIRSLGGRDVFLANVAVDGRLTWAKRVGGPGDDSTIAPLVLSDGSAILVGTFVSVATFGKGEPRETTLTTSGTAPAAFFARFSP